MATFASSADDPKPDRHLLADPLGHDLVQPLERAAADEEDVAGIDLDVFLMGVLAPALRRDVGDGALDDLQQRLLHALAGDVAGDARVVRLARDLVDLVDVDDAGLRAGDIAGGLDQPEQDILDVFADIAGLGQRGGIGDRERHIEQLGQRLRQQRLAAAGWPDEQDVALLQLDVVVAVEPGVDALVVVVDRDGQDLLGAILADDVLLSCSYSSRGVGMPAKDGSTRGDCRLLLFDDLAAKLHAFIADIDLVWPGDEPAYFFLALVAEGAPVMHPPTSRRIHAAALTHSRCRIDAREDGVSGSCASGAPLARGKFPLLTLSASVF